MSKKIQMLIIVLVTVLAYANIFGNGFVIDDQYFMKEWNLTRSWGSVGQLLAGANPESQPGVYRPIRSLLYLVYYQLWGTNPFFYHLHSLMVHLAATVLVYGVIREIGGRREMGFIGGLLFGLHPIHTESITYIAASMEMTGVVFFFGAFLAYLKEKRIVAMILALFAFFTYEMTITLPLLLVLYEGTLGGLGRLGKLGEIAKKTWVYWAGAAGFFVVRFALGVGLGRGEYLAYSFFHTQLTMVKMWVKYLLLLIWPVTLSHNHTVVPGFEAFMTPYSDQAAILSQTILDPEILLSIGVIGGIGVMGWKTRKKYPLVSFCVGWFFVSVLPVAYFLPQGTAIAEKYLYIASFGWATVLAYGISNISREAGSRFAGQFPISKAKKISIVIVVIIAIFYGMRTYTRNADWRSPRTLWEYEARIHPASELAFYNLGIIYGQSGEREKAVAAYTKALNLKPQFWQARHNLEKL